MEKKYTAYLGKWGFKPEMEKGVLAADYDEKSGRFTVKQRLNPELSCGMVCTDAEKRIVYYTCENRGTQEAPGGKVYAFSADLRSGELTELGRVPSLGMMPSYLAFDQSKKYLGVTHHAGSEAVFSTKTNEDGSIEITRTYEETSIVLFKLNEDGSVGQAVDIDRVTGHGANPDQQNPHLHSLSLSPDGSFFFVCDKGADRVYTYRIDSGRGKLVRVDTMQGLPGSSPRYSIFHPTEPLIYFNNESRTVVNVVSYDKDGRLFPVGTVSPRPDGSTAVRGMQGDFIAGPGMKVLYDVLRESAEIAVFSLEDPRIPKLVQVVKAGNQQAGRGLVLSPDGRFLHVAAFPDNGVITYRIREDGTLADPFVQLEDEELLSVISFLERG